MTDTSNIMTIDKDDKGDSRQGQPRGQAYVYKPHIYIDEVIILSELIYISTLYQFKIFLYVPIDN